MNTKFNPQSFEQKWRKYWDEHEIHKTPEINEGDEKSYVLDMYPYPSGSGLHVGHPRGYLGTDVFARFQRMRGKKVLHPIGFDSFGLPAENFAIKTGTHPQITTDNAIKMFKEQIKNIGLSYDWSRELSSHNPSYYKWTQKIFLMLYKKGLAYQKEAPVNWCPQDNTVLANEQVEADGTCERCGATVVQKNMKQWFFKITDYADRLIDDLDKVDWPESTKSGQRNWIGRSEGAVIKFPVVKDLTPSQQAKTPIASMEQLEVFTTAHDTIYGATFMVIAPEHEILLKLKDSIENLEEVQKYIEDTKKKTELERQQEKDKTGVEVKGIKAVNPVNNALIPIYVADYVLASYGTGSIMAVPGHDERDFEFANKYSLPIIYLVKEHEGYISFSEKIKKEPQKYTLINSAEFDGMNFAQARERILEKIEKDGFGKSKVQFRLRDWLVSRQRYWGCPIPIVYDPEGNAHPVDESDLPVLLPTDVDFKPTGESPLKDSESFHKSAEEKYGKGWKREVDTMDTFVDSTWYFFRFTDVNNENEFASSESMNAWMPVDLYVGGAEHTVLHLMYARFLTKVLFDEGIIDFDEPFQKLRHQGMILAEDGRKMSKRWGNTLDPNEEIEKYGADTFRMYEMFMGPLDSTMPWDTKTEIGVRRFLERVWGLQYKVDDTFQSESQQKEVNKLIKKVTQDIQNLSFNTSIAKFMEFSNLLSKEEKIVKEVWEKFLLVMAPFAPYITEELWQRIGNSETIHLTSWPEFDEEMIKDEVFKVAIQVNGKLRATLEVSINDIQEEVYRKAIEIEAVKKYVSTEPKKVIYIQGRILNIVV